jgi:hypothetical protein
MRSGCKARLFEHPELIPVQRIDPGSKTVIPICRELPLPRLGSTVFLDMLGVTPTGRPGARRVQAVAEPAGAPGGGGPKSSNMHRY